MCTRILALLAAWAMLLATPALSAEPGPPMVYLFASASCPYSKAARSFLQTAQAGDAALSVHDFETDESPANLRLLGRLYDKIGLPQLRVVPTIVIGHHVIIGFIDDGSTGREILDTVAECRRTACKDAVRDLIDTQDRFEAVAGLPTPAWRPACRREPGRAVR